MQELLSISDISSKYKISRYTVWNWYRRDSNFPKPIQCVNNGKTPIFIKSEIEKFLKIQKANENQEKS